MPQRKCEEPACAVARHKAAIHDVDIVWHYCPELGCEYRAKVKGSIKEHRASLC